MKFNKNELFVKKNFKGTGSGELFFALKYMEF